MNKEFVKYEQALALKELGFDEPCFGYYDEGGNLYTEMVEVLKAPLCQQAFRWFREKGLNYTINPYYSNTTDIVKYELMVYHIGGSSPMSKPIIFKTYEEAESACLDKLIEIVKNK